MRPVKASLILRELSKFAEPLRRNCPARCWPPQGWQKRNLIQANAEFDQGKRGMRGRQTRNKRPVNGAWMTFAGKRSESKARRLLMDELAEVREHGRG
jgi:hypothetical protein